MSPVPSKLPGRFSETAIDDEIVIMQLDHGTFFSLSGTGRAIWELIDGRASRNEIVDVLAVDYPVASATIAADVDVFLAELSAAGLIDAG